MSKRHGPPQELLDKWAKKKSAAKVSRSKAKAETPYDGSEPVKHVRSGVTVGGVKVGSGTRLPCVYDKR